ncbi:Chitinase II [Penicillium longicatenatum]|uniref:Chitinase II n=1 Tax=Penicillium longicatenatum TaxID=1561947 RepID=UPI002548913B|nr:Chitinase II [Penicillium longicatenatum]KAJ5639539.1 Chitinase II [Penicillium longicatenatum]
MDIVARRRSIVVQDVSILVTTNWDVTHRTLVQVDAEENCVTGCDSKAECDPGEYGLEFADAEKCPLNVCCSKFGFCGVTEEFCGNKTVDRGHCSESGGLDRVVGYFEGWASRRPCNRFWPENIPGGVYSHINFAFATIDPETFEVKPADDRDIELYSRVTVLKKGDPNLKVFIAIGGWTFNDPGPTQTVFSDIAGSEENQKKFFSSLLSFMSTYDFDGIDLDWEYPEATDRNGRPEDFKNFPKFMENLRKTLDKSGGRNGISITLPASYWYLQHFDIKALAKSVSFFNIMSYDLHGTWDMGNKWTGEYLNAHTNLTEIDLALDLLWRNDIDKKMVVMGLAFYGRAYTINPACTSPGCLYLSGGLKGECSREVGVLLNNEIDQIREDKGGKPTLDKDAAVKLYTWDDQWVSYDDADTFLLKTNFARKRCLGGVMVWAISHDTAHGDYSKALGEVTGYVGSAQFDYGYANVTEKNDKDICHWTNCGQSCPAGWHMIKRADDWFNFDGEVMIDASECGEGIGYRSWCCPPGDSPTCGWYEFNDGLCDGGCPSGMKEIGSTQAGCREDTYQTACCTSGISAMALYDTCEWGATPQCETGTCSYKGSTMTTLLGESGTGSGGTWCHDSSGWDDTVWPKDQLGEQKYCCNTEQEDKTWQNCEWVKNIGLVSKDMSCVGFCPQGKVKVAMDVYNHGCYNRGYQTYCCEPSYYTETSHYSEDVQAFQDALGEWGDSPTCAVGGSDLEQRSTDTAALATKGSSDTPAKKVREFIIQMLAAYAMRLAGNVGTMCDVWDNYVDSKSWSNLECDNLYQDLQNDSQHDSYLIEYGSFNISNALTCDPDLWNTLLSDDDTEDLVCDWDPCTADPSMCTEEGFDNDYITDGSTEDIRRRAQWEGQRKVLQLLDKRTDEKQDSFVCFDGVTKVVVRFWRQGYPSSGQWATSDPIYDEALDNQEVECTNTETSIETIVLTDNSDYHTEHIIELQSMPMFFAWLVANSKCQVDCDFFTKFFNKDSLTGTTPLPGGYNSGTPSLRIMEALGSWTNDKQFRMLQKRLNGMKAQLWRFYAPREDSLWQAAVKNASPNEALTIIKRVITVFSYLNDPEVWGRLKTTNKLIRQELKLAQDAYNKANGKNTQILDCWDEWFAGHLDRVVEHSVEWLTDALDDMDGEWTGKKGKLRAQVIRIVKSLRTQMGKKVKLNTQDLI